MTMAAARMRMRSSAERANASRSAPLLRSRLRTASSFSLA